MESTFKNNIKTLWKTIYAFFDILHVSQREKDFTRKVEITTKDGNPTIRNNILLRIKNNPRTYTHIGIIGFSSNLFDTNIKYTFPDDNNSE